MSPTEKSIAVIGTLDTKGKAFLRLKERIQANGFRTLVIDCGVRGTPYFRPDYCAEDVARQAGCSLERLREEQNLSRILDVLAEGAAALAGELYREGRLAGAVSMGGGQGTFLGMSVMRRLPIGLPKIMVSTLAQVEPALFQGARDTMIMDPIADIEGMNALLADAVDRAADAVCGMARGCQAHAVDKTSPVIALTMFGVTTKCADRIVENLNDAGYEVWVFHAAGIGGANMESLIRSGRIKAVIDLTTTEIGQTLLGGRCAGTADRLEAAGDMGIPQIVVPGAVDVCNFSGMDSVPADYRKETRIFHAHNSSTVLMRTNAGENAEIGRVLAEKLNRSKGRTCVCLPLRGISEYDKEGGVWYAPEVDQALFSALQETLSRRIELISADLHINDTGFADMLSQKIVELLGENQKSGGI